MTALKRDLQMKQNAARGRTTVVFSLRPCTVCNTTKDRLIIFGLVLAAAIFILCSVAWAHTTLEASLNLCPWAHMTLEASLNLLWVLLAFGAVAHWITPGRDRRRGHLPGLVSLVFVLSLLFPVISANDDLARMVLINDATASQSIKTGAKCDKHPAAASALGLPSLSTVHSTPFRILSFERSGPNSAASVGTPGEATGNHSPPLC